MKNRQNRYLLNCMYLNQTSMGIYLLLIGAVLPLIRAEYGLSYKLSGIMMGVQSCGYFLAGLAAPLLPGLFGIKKTYLALANLALIGLGLIIFTGNPLLLLFAMLLTGLSKGSCGNYNNSIVSNLTGNDASSLNFLQACFAIGACIAPLIALICGASWRMAFLTEIVIGIAILVYCLGMKIGKDAYPVSVSKSGMDFGFFRSKVFWICAAFLSCYMAIEACIMGFLVTYYVDTGLLPAHMLLVMSVGVAVSFLLFIFGGSIIPVTIGSVGLGLFMAGMYGTAIGDVGDLLEKYSMSMGMLIVIPGLVSTLMPSLIGILADLWDIRRGMMAIFALIILLLAVTMVNLRQKH